MRLIIRTKGCLHLLTLAWVILWVAAVPLFHTHLPDVNDGLASHQGLAHTVFCPDLPGEFSSPHRSAVHLSTKSQNSPELGFVLSTEDSKNRTEEEPSALYVLSCQLARSTAGMSAIESRAAHRKYYPLDDHHASRAPPSLVFS
jgi:hypothetical protein